MTKSSLENIVVVLVDDDNLFSRQIIAILQDNDMDVSRARDAEGALKLCRKKRPHIVICDYPLPDMDYPEWISRLRLMNIFRVLTISSVQVTARVVNELHSVLGVPKVMQKPVRPEQLVDSLQLLLTLPESGDQPVSKTSGSSGEMDGSEDSNRMFSQRDAADIARWINSLTVMARSARQNPEKHDFMVEALAQAERITKAIETQNIEKLKEPFKTINTTLTSICEQGSKPYLEEWDALESTFLWLSETINAGPVSVLLDPRPLVPARESATEINATEASGEASKPSSVLKALIPVVAPKAVPVALVPGTAEQTLKCLVVSSRAELTSAICEALREEPLELGFTNDNELALSAMQSGEFALVIVVLPSASQANLDLLMFTEEAKRVGPKATGLIFVVDDTSTMHTRVLACHQPYCRMVPADSIRSAQFLELIAETTCPVANPSVLIVDESVSRSETLFRLIAQQGAPVKSTAMVDEVPSLLDSYSPDIVYLGARITNISVFDLCRVIRRTVSSQSCVIVLELERLDVESVSAAYQAGADLLTVFQEPPETKSNRILSTYRRMRSGPKQGNSVRCSSISGSLRNMLEEGFSQAARNQKRLTLVHLSGCEDVPNETTMSQIVSKSMKELSISLEHPPELLRLQTNAYILLLFAVERRQISCLIEELQRVLSEITAVGSSTKVEIRSCSYPDDGVTLSHLLSVIRLGN